MELREFVSTTLTQIALGVAEAQKHQADVANPAKISPNFAGNGALYHHLVQQVTFDVALTTVEGERSEGGIGVFLGSFGMGGKEGAESTSTSLSRVSFSVPVVLPSAGKSV